MPQGDGTGPYGLGGWCTGRIGRGGLGRGRGDRRMFLEEGLPRWSRNMRDYESSLRTEEKMLEMRLQQVKKELQEYEGNR
ncbi:MAG: hypothetical protein KKD39_03250 [Candidatus Altiarchaeota archaeon]|nr:hypothetical protein [Candidatus Altiarchaeota archaeon]